MKRKVCIIICGLMLALALCSCGQSSSSSSKTTSSNSASGENVTTEEKKSLNKADLGWLKFDIPEDFRLDEDSKYTDASIVKKGDSSCKLNFFYVGSSKDIDMDTAIQDILEENGGELEEAIEIAGRKWYPIKHGLTRYYTQLDNKHYLYVAPFELTKDDEAFMTVFESIELDGTKLPE